MQDKLHLAATNGDYNAIVNLSKQPGFNVNLLHPVHNTLAIDIAAQKGHLSVLKYLIEDLGAKVDLPRQHSLLYWALKSGNAALCRYVISATKKNKISELLSVYRLTQALEDLEQVEIAIKNGADGIDDTIVNEMTILGIAATDGNVTWPDRTIAFKFFKLLLQHNADIRIGRANPLSSTFMGPEKIRSLLAETIIRGDLEAYLQLINRPSKPKPPTINEIADQLGDRKLKNLNLTKIQNMLQTLINEHYFDPNLAKEISNYLEKQRDLTLLPDEYPDCLKHYLSNNTFGRFSADDLVLQLQYARKLIPTPYNVSALDRHQDQNFPEHLAHYQNNKNLYKKENLIAFIQPKNQIKALMEMRLYPEILDWICAAAVHPDINSEDKAKCIALLHHLESPSQLEEAILSVGEVSFNSAQVIANEVSELKDEVSEHKKEVSELKEKVNKLTDQLQDTNTKLDVLIGLITAQQPAKKSKIEPQRENVTPITTFGWQPST